MSVTPVMTGLTVVLAWKCGYFSWGTQFFTCRDNMGLWQILHSVRAKVFQPHLFTGQTVACLLLANSHLFQERQSCAAFQSGAVDASF